MRRSLLISAMLAVAALSAQPSSAALLKTLPDAPDRNKITILRALVQTKAADAYPAFVYYLGYGRTTQVANPTYYDLTKEIRTFAAQGIAIQKRKEALPMMITALQEERDWNCVEAILLAIGEIGDPTAIPFLVRYMLTTDDFFHRHSCVVAITKIKDDQSITPLLEVMKGPYLFPTKALAKEALKNLGWTEDLGYN